MAQCPNWTPSLATKRLAGYKRPITTWADLGVKGDLAKVKISPYGILEEKNGTVETFRHIVLRGGPLAYRSVGIHEPTPQGDTAKPWRPTEEAFRTTSITRRTEVPR